MGIMKFLRPKNELETGGRNSLPEQKAVSEPEMTCPNCHKTIPMSKLKGNQFTCQCGHHFRMSARQRLSFITDEGSFTEMFTDVENTDPLQFPGYKNKLETLRKTSKEN